MDDFQRELLARLPLAQAVFHLFSYVLNGEALGRLYETYRGRCYERELTFEHLVYLVRDASTAAAPASASSTPGRPASCPSRRRTPTPSSRGCRCR